MRLSNAYRTAKCTLGVNVECVQPQQQRKKKETICYVIIKTSFIRMYHQSQWIGESSSSNDDDDDELLRRVAEVRTSRADADANVK